MIRIQSFVLGVALSILQKVKQKLAGFDWPATLGGTVNFGLKINIPVIKCKQNRIIFALPEHGDQLRP